MVNRLLTDEILDEASGNRWSEQGITSGDYTHRVDEFGGGRILEEKATRPRTQGFVDIVVQVEGGEYKYASW